MRISRACRVRTGPGHPLPAEARQRSGLGVVAHTAFELLLVGRDGGVKLRRDAPVAASEITALIDTMPMRQAEMRR